MYLTLQVLNADATLNDFNVIDVQKFSGGADVDFVFRLLQPDKKLRYVPVSGSTISIQFKKSDNTSITKTGTFIFADDRSVFKVSLTSVESATVITQYIKAVLNEAGVISHAILEGAIQRVSPTCSGI